MHLEITVIVLEPRTGQLRIAQRGEDLRAAEEATGGIAAPLDVARLALPASARSMVGDEPVCSTS